MAKRFFLLFAALIAMLCLSGCNSSINLLRPTDELYCLPKASEENTSLEESIKYLMEDGLEYAPPLSGMVTQPVRLRDLDGDGETEALVFMRNKNADTTPLNIYIFKKDEDGEYQEQGMIAGEGTDINSVLACQLIGDESSTCELIVSWQISAAVYTVSAYSLEDYDEPVELMTPVLSTRYAAMDIDSDGEDELILLNVDNSRNGISTAVLYDKADDRIVPTSTANLSGSLSSLDKVRVSVVSDGVPALYVTGTVWEESGNSSFQITDIFTGVKGELCNVTLDSSSQNSDSTARFNLTSGQDINGDEILELPIPVVIPSLNPDSADTFYGAHWQQYAADGSFHLVATTYYNTADGWYLDIPDSWLDSITLARQDTVTGATNERGIAFYAKGSDKPFLAIYKNSGTNKESRGLDEGRFLLQSDSASVYSAELIGNAPGETLSSRSLLRRFHLIATDWNVD